MRSSVKGVIYKIFPTDVFPKYSRRKFWLKEVNVPVGARKNTFEIEVQHDLCDFLPQFEDVTREVVCSVEIKGNQYGDTSGDRVKHTIVCYDIKFAE